MTNIRKKQVKTLAILLIAVIALTVGFAAFTSSLRIKTRLSVNPNKGTFAVKFSKVSNSLDENNVIPTKSSEIFEAFPGIIDNSGIPTISDLGGEFTQPGESITYEFYAINMGEYKAYLTDVIFGNVDGESVNKVCTSLDGTHESDVDVACNNISIKVTVESDILTTTRSNLVGHELNPGSSEKVVVEIKYASGGILPEVPFEVTFGDISMIYNSLEANDIVEVDNSSCFGVEARVDEVTGETYGVITGYDERCGTEVEIPSRAYITEPVIFEGFNYDKCLAYATNPEENCSTLKEIYDNNDTENENYQLATLVFSIKKFEKTDTEIDITEIGEAAFGLSIITDISIPNSVKTIGKDAFAFSNLENVDLGSGVEEIGKSSFSNCKLTSVIIPSSVKTIGQSAFEGNKLTSATIPDTVTEIGSFAFYYNYLTSVNIPSNITEIKQWTFAYNNLTQITIPNNVTTIGEFAFISNKLTELSIPDSVTEIVGSAFRYNNLTRVEIGSGITSIGYGAFGDGTTTREEVTGENVTYGSNQLEYVKIDVVEPASGTTLYTNLVGNSQFYGYSGTITWKTE